MSAIEIADNLRKALRSLFGSRMTERLEYDILQLRQDYDARLKDKDDIITNLREEKALLASKVTMYEMTIMPHASRMGAEVVSGYVPPAKPNFSFFQEPPMKTRWQAVVEEHEKQMAQEIAEEEAKKKTAEAAKA